MEYSFLDSIIDSSAVTDSFFDTYMNLELLKTVSMDFARCFCIGFAFATVLALLTYGVFKAFSLLSL